MTENDNLKMKKTIRTLRMVNVVLIILVFLSLTFSYGWFYYGRNAIAIEKVSNPTSIFINSGNQENFMYIDLGALDVSKGVEKDENHKYQDIIFGVRGVNVSYKMQLAYTTNNQFSFEIYVAKELTSSQWDGLNFTPTGYVNYVTHTTTPETKIYATVSGDSAPFTNIVSPIAGTFRNSKRTVDGEELGQLSAGYGANKDIYEITYDDYENVEKHAVPIYWQTNSSFVHNGSDEFCDYFILRIIWNKDLVNNKETDIVYITAKNVAS